MVCDYKHCRAQNWRKRKEKEVYKAKFLWLDNNDFYLFIYFTSGSFGAFFSCQQTLAGKWLTKDGLLILMHLLIY